MPKGGKRPGAGRKRKPKPKLAGLTRSVAADVLHAIDEKGYWLDLLSTDRHRKDGEAHVIRLIDSRLQFDVLKYLTDRRDGRPVQQVRIANPEGEKFKLEVDVTSARDKLIGALLG
jgi:hypothetical protein